MSQKEIEANRQIWETIDTKGLRGMETKPQCHWCEKEAKHKTYRTIDGVTGRTMECSECLGFNTNYLIEQKYPTTYCKHCKRILNPPYEKEICVVCEERLMDARMDKEDYERRTEEQEKYEEQENE